MKTFVKVLLVVLVVVLLISSSNCFVVTHQNEYTVIRQFGEVVDIRSEAGISFKLPFFASSITTSARPEAKSLSEASLKAPTPGRMSLSAFLIVSAELVTTTSKPMRANELFREKRLPTP